VSRTSRNTSWLRFFQFRLGLGFLTRFSAWIVVLIGRWSEDCSRSQSIVHPLRLAIVEKIRSSVDLS